jgi:enoyl-CoA hydratase/carnithine racemase
VNSDFWGGSGRGHGEIRVFAAAFAGQDFAEGAAAFVERRKPQFIA